MPRNVTISLLILLFIVLQHVTVPVVSHSDVEVRVTKVPGSCRQKGAWQVGDKKFQARRVDLHSSRIQLEAP